MSIARKVMEEPGRYSIQQLQQAMERGILPAYVAIPLIQEKTQLQKQFQQQQMMQQPPVEEMPPIADQIMQEAQMAQAAPGVEGLPSNLPQEYAGGGIVAFDEGGEVERYQTGRLVESEEQRRAREAYEEANPFLRLLKKRQLTEEEAAAIAAGEAEQQQYYGKPDTSLIDAASAVGRGLRALIPGAGEAAIPSGMGAEMGMGGEYQAPSPTTVPSAPMAGRPDMMDANRAMAGARAPAAGPGAAPAGFGGLFPKKPVLGSEETEAEKRFDAAEKQEAARRTKYEEERKKVEGSVPGRAFDLLDKQLQEEALQAGATKEQAKYMALIEAGLAMMSGTSQNALENIGKGALVGVNSYKSALKDIEKAQKEHRRALASIDQARRAEALGDRDRQLSFMEKAYNAETESARARVDGIMKARGVDRATALKIYEIDYGGAKTQIQAAASMARGQGRGGLTQAQMASITDQAIKSIGDRAMFDLAAAKKLGGKGATPPTSGPIRDKIDKMYQDEVKRRVRERLQFISGYGMEEADPNAGYERVTE